MCNTWSICNLWLSNEIHQIYFHPEVSSSERLQDPSEGQDEFEDDHVEGDGAGEVTTCHDWISKFGGLQIYSKVIFARRKWE